MVIPAEVNVVPVTKISFSFCSIAGCDKITSIVLPDTIDELKVSICYGLKNLKSITLPANITYIPPRMFSGCESLEEI
ncbi:leucine-rich repeat protein [Ruminococcus flavefaciens]|uniref:leucine-rich repeat protein n=1 Tax=Ruminococcus flavefaciens TaxID=1265 RepID=UPI0009D643E1